MLGVLPALMILFIRRHVPESPAWEAEHRKAGKGRVGFIAAMKGHWPRMIYAVVLMTCFNFFSHGTQDLYPTFLKVQHKFDAGTVTALTMVLNVGAIVGGLTFGALSEKIGRRKGIVLAALLALPIIPLWAFSATPLMLGLGAFLIQIVRPRRLGRGAGASERAVPARRARHLPRLHLPDRQFAGGGQRDPAGGHRRKPRRQLWPGPWRWCAGIVAVTLAVVAWFGPEAKGVDFVKAGG